MVPDCKIKALRTILITIVDKDTVPAKAKQIVSIKADDQELVCFAEQPEVLVSEDHH